MKKIYAVTAVLTLLYLGGIAHAALVSYTVDGWGPMQYPGSVTPPADAPWGTSGYPGDTLEFQTYTGTLDLTPGTYTLKINTLLWTIDYTYGGTATDPNVWSDVLSNVTTSRSISIGSVSGSLSQTGLLVSTWENDFVTFYDGTTASIIVQGYQVDITPLAFDTTGGSNFSGINPWVQPDGDILARFEVSALPEPGTLFLLGSGLLGLVGFGRKRIKK
jgi:hypothetical protein